MKIETRNHVTGDWREVGYVGEWLELLTKEAKRQFAASPSLTMIVLNNEVRFTR